MTADFTPSQNSYNELGQFRFWCQKVLPLTYDDSLSYYELLCKVVNILNGTIENVELMGDDITKLHKAYNELQQYVNIYFTNLDVQSEINNKLNKMVSDGTFTSIVEPYIPTSVTSWLNKNVSGSNGVVDKSFTIEGAGADAKAVGNEIKASGRVFTFVTGLAGQLVVEYADNTYTVKWVDNVTEHTIYGVCGNVQKGISNVDKSSSSVVTFNELTLVQESGYVSLVFDRINNTFSLKPNTQVGINDYACLVMYGGNIDFLGNDAYFTNYRATNMYNARKYMPIFDRKAEVIGGSVSIDTRTKTVKGNDVYLSYGVVGGYDTHLNFELSYSDLTEPDYAWYLIFDANNGTFIVNGASELLKKYTSYEYANYYVVFGCFGNKVYNVTPIKGRYFLNGSDVFGSANSPFDVSVLRLCTGVGGSLNIGYDTANSEYFAEWVDENEHTIYGVAGDKMVMLTNTEESITHTGKFTRVTGTVEGTIFVGLVFNTGTNTISFKTINNLSYGDYCIALLYQNYIDFLGNDNYFVNYVGNDMYYVRKYVPFFGRKAEIMRGAIEIDTVNRKVYTKSSLVIAYAYNGGFASNVTFNIDYNLLANPTYIWYAMYNNATKTVEIMGSTELNEVYSKREFNNYYLLFAYYNGKVFNTSSIAGMYYLNGNDLFGGSGSLDKYTLLSNKTFKIFKKVVCCGDSYTAGYIVDKSGTAHRVNEDYSWVHYMATDSGNDYINCGESGANVITWQTAERGLLKAKQVGKAQAYIIGLGINDSSDSTRHIDVGSISDIGTNNQTYYAGLSKIIRELKAISPNAIIFVQNLPNASDRFTPYNQAISNVVNAYKDTYNVHLLDLLANIDLYSNPAITGDALSGHYTAIGYEVFAQNLAHIMSKYINENISVFQDVAFIPYD